MSTRKKKAGWQMMYKSAPYFNPDNADPGAAEVIKAVRAESHGKEQWWANDRYSVCERRYESTEPDMPLLVHLSIHDRQRTSRHDWRDFQRIKNDIVGPEEEGFELYPAESRLVDTSNEYHLWILLGVRLSVGWNERLVSEGGFGIGAKQRPWSDGDRPADCRDITKEEIISMADKK